MKCTCYIGETESLGQPILRQCNLCYAAPTLLEACRAAQKLLAGSAMKSGPTAQTIEAAIKLAEEGQ